MLIWHLSCDNRLWNAKWSDTNGKLDRYFPTAISTLVEKAAFADALQQNIMPVVAGLSYELIRIAGRTTSPFVQTLVKPGLWLQLLTTRKPHPDQIEVAIKALEAARPEEMAAEVQVK